MNAASQGKLIVIDKYLADGGNPNVHDEVHMLPCVAVNQMHSQHTASHYLQYFKTFQLKRTALHRASVEGHTAVVQALLEKGADINFQDQVRHAGTWLVCKDDDEIG